MKPRLPTDPTERKKIRLDLVDDYFCDALAEVSKIIAAGQEQHGTTGWDRTKSNDHEACIRRHSIDRGTFDTDGQRHTAKRAWRALAALQIELEQELGLEPPRGVSVRADPAAPEHVIETEFGQVRTSCGQDCAVCDDWAAMGIVPPTDPQPMPRELWDALNGPFTLQSAQPAAPDDEPVQLELPFTGKQLTLTELAPGARVRVIESHRNVGPGEELTFEGREVDKSLEWL